MRDAFRAATQLRAGQHASLRKLQRIFKHYPGFLETGVQGEVYKDNPARKYLNSSRTVKP